MGQKLSGKVAAVTGAASGIGLECSRAMLAEGATVVLVDRAEGPLRNACRQLGPNAIALVVDLTDPESVSGMMPQIGKVKLGSRRIVSMNLILPQQHFVNQTLNDNKIGNGAEVDFANLPPDFQSIVAKRLEALKASPMGSLGGMLGAFGSLGKQGQP